MYWGGGGVAVATPPVFKTHPAFELKHLSAWRGIVLKNTQQLRPRRMKDPGSAAENRMPKGNYTNVAAKTDLTAAQFPPKKCCKTIRQSFKTPHIDAIASQRQRLSAASPSDRREASLVRVDVNIVPLIRPGSELDTCLFVELLHGTSNGASSYLSVLAADRIGDDAVWPFLVDVFDGVATAMNAEKVLSCKPD